jgi:glycosyltransferase involved in cell wall biosynthesis
MSDSPTSPTGLGNVTRFVCAGLAELGHEVSIIGWQKRGPAQHLRRYTVYPAGDETDEATVLLRHLRKLRPDVLITFADPWRMGYVAQPRLSDFMRSAGIVWAYYYPIDTDMGRGRLPSSTIHLLQTADLPIAMSNYGRRLAERNGVRSAYIPHGVDTSVFRPPREKALAKEALGYSNRFVVLSDARNQIRKMWPRTLEIFRRFARDKDDVLLHIHCDPYDPASRLEDYSYDIVSDIKFLGLTEKVRFTRGFTIRRGTSLGKLASLYRASDVHLLSSFGEGFGVPTLQAAAAGVVPMASAYTASLELVKGHGEAVRVDRFLRDGWGLRRALIDIDDAVEKLDRLYYDEALLRSKSKAASKFAERYSWQRIIPQWDEMLTREVPRLRKTAAARKSALTRSLVSREKSKSSPQKLNHQHRLPANIQSTIDELEKGGDVLTAEMFRDCRAFRSSFTLPVTPQLTNRGVSARVIGRVYLASAADVPVFLKLKRIFPGLSAWSTLKLRFGVKHKNHPTWFAQVARSDADFSARLGASTFALDRVAFDLSLPVKAVQAGVPLIGSARCADQQWLWPHLAVEPTDLRIAAEKLHWMLTDQSAVIMVCELAKKRDATRRQSTAGRKVIENPQRFGAGQT